MPKVIVSLNISEKDILKFYKGNVQNIVAHADDGRVVRFPINTVRQFIGMNGIKGRFQIEFSSKGKLLSIKACD